MTTLKTVADEVPRPSGTDFCREAAISGGLPVIGTATASTAVWLLLEVREPWESKAYDKAKLPAAVREHVDGWLRDLPASRIQLIRRESARQCPTTSLTFMLAWTGQERPGWSRFVVPSHEALLDIDAGAELARLQAGGGLDAPLVLVCTHGKRDRCCAKWGLPVYQALDAGSDVEVWQTSHLGGHRFAATALTFPFGLNYGRLEPEEVPDLVLAEQQRRIAHPHRLRGRTCLSESEQVAEFAVREQLGCWDVDAMRVTTSTQSEAEAHVVVQHGGGLRYAVSTRRVVSDPALPSSCGDTPKRSARWVVETVRAG